MKFKKLVPVLAALCGLSLATPVSAQEINPLDALPKARIEFVGDERNLSSLGRVSLDKGQFEGDFTIGLGQESFRHNIGLDLLLKNDPVWSTINAEVKYGLELAPSSFFKQELDTRVGYQRISNKTYKEDAFSAEQFFAGGEETITLGVGENARLESTGKVGGYLSLINGQVMWDNYRAGYGVSGKLPVSFLDIGAWFNQTYKQFNKDRYFFIDSSNEIKFGARLGINLEELTSNIFFEKEYIFGKELDAEKIHVGGDILLNDYGVGFRAAAEFNQLNPNSWKVSIAGGKTVFRDSGYFELSLDLTNNGPAFGIGFRLSPEGDGNSVIIRENLREYHPLIREQGYTQQGRTFEEFVESTNTPAEVGNIGLYIPYKTGATNSRTPKQVFENRGGSCAELAELRALLLDTFYAAYTPRNEKEGHAFTLFKDTDGRAYVLEDDSRVWFQIRVDENASLEELAKASIAQLHTYLRGNPTRGYYLSLVELDEEKVRSYVFSGDVDYEPVYLGPVPPFEIGLETHIGEGFFYRN